MLISLRLGTVKKEKFLFLVFRDNIDLNVMLEVGETFIVNFFGVFGAYLLIFCCCTKHDRFTLVEDLRSKFCKS